MTLLINDEENPEYKATFSLGEESGLLIDYDDDMYGYLVGDAPEFIQLTGTQLRCLINTATAYFERHK